MHQGKGDQIHMKTRFKGMGAAAGFAGCALGLIPSGCASSPEIERREGPGSIQSSLAVDITPSAAEGEVEFQAEATIDAAGKILNRRVGLPILASATLDQSLFPKKPTEIVQVPDVISPALAAALRSSPANGTTEVVVSVRHNVPFGRLTSLRDDLPRNSDENQKRLLQRRGEIDAVELSRRPSRAAVIARARTLGAHDREESTLGNAVALEIPNAAVAQLALDPDVLEVSLRYEAMRPPSVGNISNGTSAATGQNSDYWRSWMPGNLDSSFGVALLDTGVNASHTVFTYGVDHGSIRGLYDCYHGGIHCENVGPGYNTNDSNPGHGTQSASVILGGPGDPTINVPSLRAGSTEG